MVHEAMVLEYSGRHLAVLELAAALKLLLYLSLIGCIFVPWGLAPAGSSLGDLCGRCGDLSRQARCGRLLAGAAGDVDCQDARVPRAGLSGHRLDARPARHAAALRVAELLMNGPWTSMSLDIAHMLAGGLVLTSFMLLYQDRMYGLLNVFALHAVVLSASVAWQAHIQHAPHLYVTAVIAPGSSRPWSVGSRPSSSRRAAPHGRCGSASTAPSRRWSASVRPCWPAWASWRCRWWSC